jgi:hypothetical protein
MAVSADTKDTCAHMNLPQVPKDPRPHPVLYCAEAQQWWCPRLGQWVVGVPGLNTKRLKVDGFLLIGVYTLPSWENWISYVHRHLRKSRSGLMLVARLRSYGL